MFLIVSQTHKEPDCGNTNMLYHRSKCTQKGTVMKTPILVQLDIEAPEEELLALAQFIKRVGWDEFRANAVDVEEAHEIKNGVGKLQDALARAGYAPR